MPTGWYWPFCAASLAAEAALATAEAAAAEPTAPIAATLAAATLAPALAAALTAAALASTLAAASAAASAAAGGRVRPRWVRGALAAVGDHVRAASRLQGGHDATRADAHPSRVLDGRGALRVACLRRPH